MFSFLNSTILFAAVAALIPLIIHLFSRRKVKIIEFSSLRHLKSMQRRQVRRLKIRQLLLLIIRMLILLGIVLAFARPTSRDGAVGTHAAVSAVILLDNSASMNRSVADGNLFEVARVRTAELLASFGQSDEVCLLPLDLAADRGSGIAFGTAAVAATQLSQLHVGGGVANLQAGVEAARELLDQALNLNREIYLVSDRQRRNLPERPGLEETTTFLYFVDLPLDETSNLGLVSLDFGGQLLQAGHDFTIAATVKNYSDEPRSNVLASLFLDDHRVAQSDFAVNAGSEAALKFTRSVSTTGFHSGYVELSDDRFAVDNRYYFSFNIPDRFSLLIINGDEVGPFVSLALEPSPEIRGYWSVKTAVPGQLTGVRFSDYDVVLLLGAPSLAPSFVSRLKSFVRRGKSLFISYGPQTDIREFNDSWSGIAAVSFSESHDRRFSTEGYYNISSIDTDHPVFAVFPFAEEQLPEVRFFTLPKLKPGDGGRTIMRFSGDRPALVENSYGDGTVLTFCGPMGPPLTDFVSHSFFVPFVARVVEYLASDLSSLDLKLFTGDNVTRSLPGFGASTTPVELTTPDRTVYRIPPEEEAGALVIKVASVSQSGIYTVRHRGREIDRFAVNVSTEEAVLATVDNEQFATALGTDSYREIDFDDEPAAVIAGFRVGRELWQLFLWAVVLLLIAETLLSRGSPQAE